MNKLKKFMGVILSLVMMLTMGLAAPVQADETTGTITITNTHEGHDYTLYRIFDIDSYDAETKMYSYTINSAWESFFATTGDGAKYIEKVDDKYVSWKTTASTETFVVEALKFARTNNVTPATPAKTADATGTVVFTDLPMGSYLVDSSVGAVCSLGVNTPNVSIEDKNNVPTLDKTVKEDSADYGKDNDADFGQEVEFHINIMGQNGAVNYIVHDKMSDGLTLDQASIKVTKGDTYHDVLEEENGIKNYEVLFEGDTISTALGTTETVTDTFMVVFTEEFLATVTNNNHIRISYSATVNEKAVIGSTGNPNTAYLTYGDKNYATPEAKTITYVWGFNVHKYGTNGPIEESLSNASFVLYSNANRFAVFTKDETAANTYNFVKWVESGVAVNTDPTLSDIPEEAMTVQLVSDKDNDIVIRGLDGGEYYLLETSAPEGYNRLVDKVEVHINQVRGQEPYGALSVTHRNSAASIDSASPTTVRILNTSGTQLPSTGGTGTMMIYAAGAILMVLAGVLLVAKKRSAE